MSRRVSLGSSRSGCTEDTNVVVLSFVAVYLPGYKSGGPIRSLSGLVEALGDALAFKIVTADRDAGDSVPFPGIARDRWTVLGKGMVRYTTRAGRSLVSMSRLLRREPHDVLYLNSFFSYSFAIKPLVLRRLGIVPRRPTVLAPRGQFASSALALRSAKKRIFLRVAKELRLYDDVIWQATSLHEVADIHRVIGEGADIRLAEVPGVSAEGDVASGALLRHDGERLRVVFLGRIAPMKNLHFGLSCLRRVSSNVDVDIYGPIADRSYWAKCMAEIPSLPPNVNVAYRGPVNYADVRATLSGYDLFLLPTLGENHGHAILDALGAGCPVLISDRTPWNLVQEAECGWVRTLESADEFGAIIEACARATREQRESWSANARRTARRIIEDAGIRQRNVNLFMDAASTSRNSGT